MSEPIKKQDNAEAPKTSEEATVVDMKDISNLYEGTITDHEHVLDDWVVPYQWGMFIESEAHPELVRAWVYADRSPGTPVLFGFEHQDTSMTEAKYVWFKEDGVWTLDKASPKAEEPEPQ